MDSLPNISSSAEIVTGRKDSEAARTNDPPSGTKILEFDVEKLKRFGAKILSIPHLFDDRFQGALGLANLILRRDTVMLEIGDEDGLLYAEGVEPGGVAIVHVITFNRSARKDLDRVLVESADWFFKTFGVALISAWIPSHNVLALRLMTRLRWHRDGIIRSWLRFDGQLEDCHVFSLSPEELEYGWR